MSNLFNFNFLMQINPENIKGMVREENKKETTGLYNYGLTCAMNTVI